MSKIFEILGRAITADPAELIWHWLCEVSYPSLARAQVVREIASLAQQGKDESARDMLRLYQFEFPQCAKGQMAEAAFALQSTQTETASQILAKLFRTQPANTLAAYILGLCCEQLQRESQAAQFYHDCLKFKNYLHLPHQRLAAIYLKNCQYEKAADEYEQLIFEHPDDVSTLILLGHLYLAQNRFDQADDTFNKAILIHPDNFAQEPDDIDDLIEQGDAYRACELLESLSLQERPSAQTLAKYGDALKMADCPDQALIKYQQALELSPDCLEINIKLGTLHLQMHQAELAAKQFNKSMEINDQIIDAYIGLCISQAKAGRQDQAEATLSLAAAIHPNSAILMAEAASLKLAQNSKLFENEPLQADYSQCLDQVVDAHSCRLPYNQNDPQLRYRLAILLMSLSEFERAAELFGQTLQINPSHHRAQTKLAICLHQTGQKESAINHLTADTHFEPQMLDLHYKTALLYADRVKFASSMLNLERQLEDNYAGSDAGVNISVVLQNLGLLDRETAMWESLTDIAADHAV